MRTIERPAKIYVFDGGETYTAMFDGIVETDGDTVHIRYDESPTEHMHFAVLGDIVTINRVGELIYTLILEKDKPFPLPIQTPFGSLSCTVTPKTIRTDISPQSIDIDLSYDLSANDMPSDIVVKLKCELY